MSHMATDDQLFIIVAFALADPRPSPRPGRYLERKLGQFSMFWGGD